MSYKELFIELLSNRNSPFQFMDFTGLFHFDKAIGNLLNAILLALCKGLASFLDACEEFANTAYNFLSFSNSPDFVNLYNILSKYWVVPFIAILGFIALRLVLGDFRRQDLKTVIRNMGIMFFIIVLLPTIFTQINTNIIGMNFLDNIQGNSTTISSDYQESEEEKADNALYQKLSQGAYIRSQATSRKRTSDYILRCNVYDYWYLYNNSALKDIFSGWDSSSKDNNTADLDVDSLPAYDGRKDIDALMVHLKNVAADYPSSAESKSVSFAGTIFDPGNQLHKDDGYQDVPRFFDIKSQPIVSVETDSDLETTKRVSLYTTNDLWDGIGLLDGWGHESMLRYNVDFLNLIVQLIATSVMYFCIGYGVFKLIMELLLHQLFGGIIAAIDLTNGQRIKKFLSTILGIYIALLLSAITVMLYQTILNFVRTQFTSGRGIIVSILTIVLCIVMIDVPNVIGRYFNVNTGARGGLALIGAGLMASRAVGRTIASRARSARNLRHSMAARSRERNRETQRQQERAQDRAQRQQEREQEQQQRYDSAQERYQSEHGSDGNYEKYQNPIDYDSSKVGSEQNADAITQRAAAISAKNDYYGNENSPRQNIDSAGRALNADSQDVANAKKQNAAQINDAKQGQYMSIATEAEANGGNNKAYKDAAEQSLNSLGVSSSDKRNYSEYLADASFNAKNTTQIRAEAKKIQSASETKLSDKDAYVQAMDKVAGSRYHFNSSFKENIATAELRDNGSLRSGSTYNNRPNRKDYVIGSKSAT